MNSHVSNSHLFSDLKKGDYHLGDKLIRFSLVLLVSLWVLIDALKALKALIDELIINDSPPVV